MKLEVEIATTMYDVENSIKKINTTIFEVEDSRLDDFINIRLNSYVEPTKKNTPRGDKIGFSRKKYLASLLLMLEDVPLKTVAEKIDVPYGTLRNWSYNPEFKRMRTKHVVDFYNITFNNKK